MRFIFNEVRGGEQLHQNRKQSGYNFQTNTAGAAFNQVRGQGFVLGTQVTW